MKDEPTEEIESIMSCTQSERFLVSVDGQSMIRVDGHIAISLHLSNNSLRLSFWDQRETVEDVEDHAGETVGPVIVVEARLKPHNGER